MPRATTVARPTRLARALAERPKRRAQPLDLLRLARRRWLAGERIDVGALAAELGIGRATAFRWCGSRELLLGEVLWALFEPLLDEAAAYTRLKGARRIAYVCEQAIGALLDYEPLRAFIRHDPEFALRLMTSKAGPIQRRTIDKLQALLVAESERGALDLPLPVDTLAYLVVRIAESFVYADIVSDQRVDVADAGLAIELLLSGQVKRRQAARP